MFSLNDTLWLYDPAVVIGPRCPPNNCPTKFVACPTNCLTDNLCGPRIVSCYVLCSNMASCQDVCNPNRRKNCPALCLRVTCNPPWLD